jgi:AraC-like DNA-binding protein
MNTTPAGDEPQTLRFSTSQFAGREAVEAFRETFGRTILQIDMEPVGGAPFSADMTLSAFGGLGMATGRLSIMRNRHSAELVDNDDLVLAIVEAGSAVLDHKGRTVEVRRGDVALTDNGEVATFTSREPVRITNLRFARGSLAIGVANLAQALRVSKVADSPALRLLKGYAASIGRETSLATAAMRRAAAVHLHDLAALALGATNDAAKVAQVRGLRAARLQAIKADILTNLGDVRLSAAAVAARHGISPRYVRLLLEAEGISFSELVLGARLERARGMLADPRQAGRTISAIAFDCGFSDLSYFNRTFRRRFGLTPSGVRRVN